ncbi:MAG: ATP-binding protein [Magnetococcus sp. YQC-9]
MNSFSEVREFSADTGEPHVVRSNLQLRLALLVLPLLVVALASLGYLAFAELRDSRMESAYMEMYNALDQAKSAIGHRFEALHSHLEVFTRSEILENYLDIEDEQERYTLLQPTLIRLFSGFQRAIGDYFEVRLILPDGFEDTRVTTSDLPNRSEMEGESPFFKVLSRQSNAPYHGMFVHPDNGEWVVMAGKALLVERKAGLRLQEAGAARGYLAVSMRPKFLADLADRQRIGRGGGFLIADGTGKIHYAYRADLAGTLLPEEVRHQKSAQGGENDPLTLKLAGESMLVLAQSVDADLIVAVVAPVAEIYRETDVLLVMTLFVGILATLVMGLAILYFLKRMVVVPLRQLRRVSARIGGGDFATPVPSMGHDEIGQVASAMEGMRHRLASLYADLASARDQAESANRAKSAFLANMSHELRTPMNAILGMSHLLMQGDPPAKQKELAGKIHTAARALLRMINDLLDFARIESNRLELARIAFRLDDIWRKVGHPCEARALEKGLRLSYHRAEDLPERLLGDFHRLQQVLFNLVDNALKFTDFGEVRVEIHLAERLSQGVLLRFEVIDSGIGMAPEQCDQLYERFTQGDGSSSRRHGGTGLGLALCKSLVGLMGGGIGVESAPGRGSRFWFTVRLEEGAELGGGESSAASSAELLAASSESVGVQLDKECREEVAGAEPPLRPVVSGRDAELSALLRALVKPIQDRQPRACLELLESFERHHPGREQVVELMRLVKRYRLKDVEQLLESWLAE